MGQNKVNVAQNRRASGIAEVHVSEVNGLFVWRGGATFVIWHRVYSFWTGAFAPSTGGGHKARSQRT